MGKAGVTMKFTVDIILERCPQDIDSQDLTLDIETGLRAMGHQARVAVEISRMELREPRRKEPAEVHEDDCDCIDCVPPRYFTGFGGPSAIRLPLPPHIMAAIEKGEL